MAACIKVAKCAFLSAIGGEIPVKTIRSRMRDPAPDGDNKPADIG